MDDPSPIHTNLRIGVIAYLNMRPLVANLESFLPKNSPPLFLAPPSQLARKLELGELDIAMVSVAALFKHPEWRIAPYSMIGAIGEVLSVLLMGDLESPSIIHPDTHSLTSNALAQIILKKAIGHHFILGSPTPLDNWTPPPSPPPNEAYVMIGSRALAWRHHWPKQTLDLALAWYQWTKLPFTFSLWAIHPGVDPTSTIKALEKCKIENRQHLPQIASEWHGLTHDRLSQQQALDYITTHIRYDFDKAAFDGLMRFYYEGRELGLFPDAWRPNFWNRSEFE